MCDPIQQQVGIAGEATDAKRKRQRVTLPDNFDPFTTYLSPGEIVELETLSPEERKSKQREYCLRHQKMSNKFFKEQDDKKGDGVISIDEKKNNHKSKLTRLLTWLKAGNHPTEEQVHAILAEFDLYEKRIIQENIGEKTIMFGKYKGTKFIDLWNDKSSKGGRSYLIWLSKQDELYGDIVPILSALNHVSDIE